MYFSHVHPLISMFAIPRDTVCETGRQLKGQGWTQHVSHSSTQACCVSFACGAGHTFTTLVNILICTTIRQNLLNLHEKIHNYVISYLHIPYQMKLLSSHTLKTPGDKIALKRQLGVSQHLLPPITSAYFHRMGAFFPASTCDRIQCCTPILHSANLTKTCVLIPDFHHTGRISRALTKFMQCFPSSHTETTKKSSETSPLTEENGRRKGLLWTQLKYPGQSLTNHQQNKINNKLVSVQFLLLVIYKKKHSQNFIFFRPGWA